MLQAVDRRLAAVVVTDDADFDGRVAQIGTQLDVGDRRVQIGLERRHSGTGRVQVHLVKHANRQLKGVLLGAYVFDSPYAYEFTALPPEDRLKKAVGYGAQIHPQYKTEYENGVAVGWHRVPWALGCF